MQMQMESRGLIERTRHRARLVFEKERCSGGETIGHGEPTVVAGALFSGGSLSETEGINRGVRQLNRTVTGSGDGRTCVWRL